MQIYGRQRTQGAELLEQQNFCDILAIVSV